MNQKRSAITTVPRAADPEYQCLLDTYVSEINKLVDVWWRFTSADLDYKPAVASASVKEIFQHQLLSERRFFAEFLGLPEVPPGEVVPASFTVDSATQRLVELAISRLGFLAGRTQEWWHEAVPFFDVYRERLWIFWRRVLHTAHHRTQLTVYLRLLGKPVPAVYGPSADERWEGADPTTTAEAAGRK